ncbi:low choriolytic enzyme-like [Drosophila innubila]|uniref:low choriolytic enzyme-like n=1 Tax=Drosophila innubila TaxID=198719 RepID=UPI00148BC037|nr:low choriolytic enzyme-like [Drosophila innubila]
MNRIFVLIFVLGGTLIEALPLISSSESDQIIDLSSLGADLYGTPDQERTAALVANYTEETDEVNPEELGSYLEGDMLVPSTLQMMRSGLPTVSHRWSQAIVPYEIKSRFEELELSTLLAAMEEFHDHTCIRFVPRVYELDYISIGNDRSGCWSAVGRRGGRQPVNLQTPSCLRKIGTVIHELMHALGFLHEQNREERDEYVLINQENIRQSYLKNFRKANSTVNFGVEYDYGSIMHYSRKAFSRNGLPTMKAIKKRYGVRMGQRWGFSESDVQKLNRMYNCTVEEEFMTQPHESNSAEDTKEETNEETNEEMIDKTDPYILNSLS